MATIYKCDRCGKIIERTEKNKITSELYYDPIREKTQNFDLCDECIRGFFHWMNKQEETPLPEYKEEMNVSLHTSTDSEKYKAGYNAGYNAALDDIGGKRK